MRLEVRLQRLEKRLNKNSKLWAVFNICYYEDRAQQEEAQAVILKNYLSTGLPHPHYKVFVQSAFSKDQEGFLYSFTSS